MKTIMLAILAFMISLSAYPESSDNSYLKLGGSFKDDTLVKDKFLSLGVQKPLLGVFDYQVEAGYLHLHEGDLNAMFFGPSIGLSVINSWYYAKVFAGPEVVTATNEHISTPYEFNLDAELGLKDNRGVGIGLGYKHMSNAGLCNSCSNLGLDLLYVKFQIP